MAELRQLAKRSSDSPWRRRGFPSATLFDFQATFLVAIVVDVDRSRGFEIALNQKILRDKKVRVTMVALPMVCSLVKSSQGHALECRINYSKRSPFFKFVKSSKRQLFDRQLSCWAWTNSKGICSLARDDMVQWIEHRLVVLTHLGSIPATSKCFFSSRA